MMRFLRLMLDWSEVWALLLPLIVLIFKRNQPHYLKPVIIYLFFAFFINLAGDIIGDFTRALPQWLQSNNILYNVHSTIRFICFSYFFLLLKQPSFITLKKVIPFISLFIIIINFKYLETFANPGHLSGNLLATEAYFLLIYCVLYYLAKLRSEEDDLTWGPDFWVATGLSIYVVVNFFVFLFYVPMIEQNSKMADHIWDVHNVAYIILCIFIAKAFYGPAQYQRAVQGNL
ncbi:MAG: hypothetical protein M3139_02855 [Bacteroidota bacterium]|nr:hypothetical protein [Bacteroidota bacterium]